MKIVAVKKELPAETCVVDLGQACGVSCSQDNDGDQWLAIDYAGGEGYRFSAKSYNFYRIAREPHDGSITISREPSTPQRIALMYEAGV